MTPADFSKVTIWQLKNLYGFSGEPPRMSGREAFWNRMRILGKSEFEIWSKWNDDMKQTLESQTVEKRP